MRLLLLALCAAGVAVAAEPTSAAPAASVAPANAPVALALNLAGTLVPLPTAPPSAAGDPFAATVPGDVPSLIDGGVLLADSDLLVGQVLTFQAGKAVLASGAFGQLEIPVEKLSALLFNGTPTVPAFSTPPGFTGAVMATGEFVSGQPVFLNAAQAGIDNGKRVVPVRRERLATLVFRATTPGTTGALHLRLVTGDRVSGTLKQAGNGFELTHAFGAWRIPGSALRGWWNDGPGRLMLTALPLTMSYSGDFEPPLVPVGIDRHSDGSWLELGALRCDHGLSLRAGSSVQAKPGGNFRTLLAVLGVVRGGPANCKVTADGKPVFESGPLAAGAAPRAVAIALNGAKDVVLSVTNVQANDPPARTVWGWTTLLK